MRDRYASLREGLVGAWIPSVSGSGLLLPDLSGNGNNGTLTNMGPEDWVSSQYGRALDFDGVDDYVLVNDSPFYVLQDFAISFWFIANYQADVNMIDKGFTTGNATRIAIQWDIVNNRKTRIYFNGAIQLTQSSTIPNGKLCQIAYTRMGSVVSCYLDGILDGQNIAANDSVISNSDTLAIGARSDLTVNFYDGQLDDIRIYNRVLSESEIKLLSQEPGVGFKRTRSVFDFGRKPAYLPPTPTDYRTVRVKQTEHASLREGLVGAWCPSIEGDGYTLPDLSGQGNNGTLTNMGPEDWVAGEYGRALDFDGVNDRVAMQGLSLEQYNIGISISAWYKVDGSSLNQYILSKNIVGIAVYINVGGPRFFVTGTSTTANVGGGGAFSVDYRNDGIWHYCCAVWSSVGEITLTSDTQKLSAAAPTTLATGADVYAIGAQSGGASPLQGQLDDIRIYNRVLSESEIKLLASRPGIGLRPQRRTMYYAPPTGARRRRILTSMP